MASINWHKDLPNFPLLEGFNYSKGSVKIESDVESGEFLQRLRAYKPNDRINLSFHFNRSQMAVWEQFYSETLKYGTEVFNFRNPINSEGLECRIQGEPEIRAIGPIDFRVIMTFVVVNRL